MRRAARRSWAALPAARASEVALPIGWPARTALLCLAALLVGHALAHATLVFGVVRVTPDPPPANAPFEVAITLEDPGLTPVEDAVVFVELRPMPTGEEPLPPPSTAAPDLPPPLRDLRLEEVAPAVYQATVDLPAAGRYHLLVRDHTFPWEETNASVVLPVTGATVGELPFILPPTQVAPRSLWTWLLWLVGIPVAAGAVVTVLVLTSKPPREPEGTAAPDQSA